VETGSSPDIEAVVPSACLGIAERLHRIAVPRDRIAPAAMYGVFMRLLRELPSAAEPSFVGPGTPDVIARAACSVFHGVGVPLKFSVA
jgi:hypothetical protein